MYHGTHALHFRIAARQEEVTSSRSLLMAFDAYVAPIDAVVKKLPAKLEMLCASFEISRFRNLCSTHIIFIDDTGRAQLQKAQFISKSTTVGNISSTSAKGNKFSFCR